MSIIIIAALSVVMGVDANAQFAKVAAQVDQRVAGKSTRIVCEFAQSESGARALMQWKLLSSIGNEGRAAKDREEVISWLVADDEALAMFLSSGEPAGRKWNAALGVLAKIVARHPEAKKGIAVRVAIATALVFAEPVNLMADGTPIDPVSRYEAFMQWDAEGVLFASFRDLCTWELRYVVGSWASNADLDWARANIKPELRGRDRVGEGAHMLAYNDANKSGVSVQAGRKFYDDKPMTLPIMLEYGGVCGAISRFGTSMSQAFGVPAMPIGQPGHCAFIWQKEPHGWVINNGITGWEQSTCHGGIFIPFGGMSWFVPVMQDAQMNPKDYCASERLRTAAERADARVVGAILAEACRKSPQNFAAWQDRLATINGASSKEHDALARESEQAFAKHPLAVAQLRAQIDAERVVMTPAAAK